MPADRTIGAPGHALYSHDQRGGCADPWRTDKTSPSSALRLLRFEHCDVEFHFFASSCFIRRSWRSADIGGKLRAVSQLHAVRILRRRQTPLGSRGPGLQQQTTCCAAGVVVALCLTSSLRNAFARGDRYAARCHSASRFLRSNQSQSRPLSRSWRLVKALKRCRAPRR